MPASEKPLGLLPHRLNSVGKGQAGSVLNKNDLGLSYEKRRKCFFGDMRLLVPQMETTMKWQMFACAM